MPWVDLNINQSLFSNIDDVSLSNRSPLRNNVYKNPAGHTVRRPGYAEFADIGTSTTINGKYYWESQNLLIVVSDNNCYKVDSSGNVTTLGSTLFEDSGKPTFADFGSNLYAANGGDIIKITSSSASALTDAQIPANVSSIAAFDTYLLANKDSTGEMHFSDVDDPEVWSGNYVTAQQSPDDLETIRVQWDQIWLFGSRTVEIFYNDGVTPFVPYSGGTISTGTLSPFTPILNRDRYYWLNENRDFVSSGGQEYQVLSDPIKDVLRESATVTDAYTFNLSYGSEEWILLILPNFSNYGITLVFDVIKQEWQGQWDYIYDTGLQYNRYRTYKFKADTGCYIPLWNKNLIGTDDGKIYTFGADYYTDAGESIWSVWRTGYIDHNVNNKKLSRRLRIRMLRGEGSLNSSPVAMLRWRDDGKTPWGNEVHLNASEIGETDFYITLRRLGQYRSRQYEIKVTDSIPLTMVSIEEDVEVVDR